MPYTVCHPDPRLDRDEILDLWRRNLPEAGEARWDWLYDRGPGVGLILRTESGEAIGSAGIMRRTFSVFGRTLSGAQAVDLNVDRRHRTIGPALALQKAVLAEIERGAVALVYGLPNPQSEAVLRRAGYREIGPLSRWIKPLSTRKVLSPRLPGWLAAPAVAMGDLLLPLTSAETYRRLPRGLRVERVTQFDERFDRLYESAASRLGVVGQRTAGYLAWRFAACPHRRQRVLGLVDRSGELLAYVVYRRRRGQVCLNDFLAAEPSHLETLLAELLRRLRRRAVQAVVTNYLGSAQVTAVLRRLGFWPRPIQWKAMLAADAGQLGDDLARLGQSDHWHLTRADLDTDE